MNIKKLAASVVTALAVMATATCFAEISKSELNINGVYCGQPWSEVISKFGQPIKKQPSPPAGYRYTFRTGNSVFWVKPADNGTVAGAGIESGDISTKAGIRIGSSLSDVKSVYGIPDDTLYGGIIGYSAGLEGDSEYMLYFSLDSSGRYVARISFGVEYREGLGTGRQSPTPQEKPKPSTPPKPKSPVPDFVTEIPKAELNIGGIEPGQDIGYTEQIYGKPGKFEDEGFIQVYNYNNKFVVRAKMNHGFKVTSVAIYEKGLKTPSGLTVGMPYEDVVKKFGKVNGIKLKGEGIEAKLKGCTDYTYFSGDKQAVFLVDKKGLVQAIRVEELDEQKYIEAKRRKYQA